MKSLVMRALREGQLFWTVIAMCAAACYEAAAHLSTMKGGVQQIAGAIAVMWVAIAWHTVVIVVSSVLVLLGTMDAVDDEMSEAARQAAEAEGNAPTIMVASIGFAIITAASFTATHVWAR